MLRVMIQDAVAAATFGSALAQANLRAIFGAKSGGGPQTTPSLTTGSQPDHRLVTTKKSATASVTSGQPLRPSNVPADAWHFKPKDGEAFWVWGRAVHCNKAMESPLGPVEAESQARRGCYVPFSFSGFHMSMTRESAQLPWWAVYDVLLCFRDLLVSDPFRIRCPVEVGSAYFGSDGKATPRPEYFQAHRGFQPIEVQNATIPHIMDWLTTLFHQNYQAVLRQLTSTSAWAEELALTEFRGLRWSRSTRSLRPFWLTCTQHTRDHGTQASRSNTWRFSTTQQVLQLQTS